MTTSIQNRQKTLQITWFCANCVQKSIPKRHPNQHLNPQILTNVSGNLFNACFRNSAFLIHCLIAFYANPPATVRFWAGDSRKNRRKKRHRNAPPKHRRLGGESDKNQFQKTPKSFNKGFNDAPPNHRRSGGESENLGSKRTLIDLDV